MTNVKHKHKSAIRAIRQATRAMSRRPLISVGTPIESYETPPQFPKFAELPEELQIKIWKLVALRPQGLEIRGGLGCHDLAVNSQINPLLLTTFQSRQIALEIFGDPFLFNEHEVPANNLNDHLFPIDLDEMAPPVTHSSLYLDPAIHTVVFDNLSTLCLLWGRFKVLRATDQSSRASMGFAKSVALRKPRVEISDFMLWNHSQCSPNMDECEFSWIARHLCTFPELGELIIIEPIIGSWEIVVDALERKGYPTGLIWRWEHRSRLLRKISFKKVWKQLPRSSPDYQSRALDSIEHFSEALREYGEKHWPELNAADQLRYGDRVAPVVHSSWWQNPITKVMTEEQFAARFR